MNLSNKYGLPDALMRAVKNDPYNKGECDFSITELIKSARERALELRHWHELEEDVSDNIWRLLGQATHSIVERANVIDIAEKRYFTKFGEYTVSAQIDSLSVVDGILTDFKVTTVYQAKKGAPPKADWVAQLNGQAEILKRQGLEVKALQIVAILRDWRPREKQNDKMGTYPDCQVAVINIPMWLSAETVAYVDDRIKTHIESRISLPECSDKERYAEKSQWALMKKGRKTAVKLFDDKIACQTAADNIADHYMEPRPGSQTKRCEMYCSVARFCTQFQKLKELEDGKAGSTVA